MNAIRTASVIDFSALDRADLQPSTRTKYRRALERFAAANVPDDGLAEYAASLSTPEKAFLKAGLALISKDRAIALKAGATPGNVAAIQALLWRVEAMQGVIHVSAQKGEKVHTWLSPKQVKQITALAAGENKQDWIVLGLLLGAGLRREELVNLTFDCVKQLPDNDRYRTVLEVRSGKGGKSRVVPIQTLLAERLSEWKAYTEGAGADRIVRISAVRVFQIVRKYGRKIKLPLLAPHDLRRTFAQLAHKRGVSIEEVSYLLGHASIKTTQRYLDLRLNVHISGSDFVPLSGD